MKTILAKYDAVNGTISFTDTNGGEHNAVTACAISVEEYVEPKQTTNVVELVAAGMTADDIIKLKHGGVL